MPRLRATIGKTFGIEYQEEVYKKERTKVLKYCGHRLVLSQNLNLSFRASQIANLVCEGTGVAVYLDTCQSQTQIFSGESYFHFQKTFKGQECFPVKKQQSIQ